MAQKKKKQSHQRRKKRNEHRPKPHLTDQLIYSVFRESPGNTYSVKSLMRKLKVSSPKDRARIADVLKKLEKEGKIFKGRSGGYELNREVE